MADNQRQMLPVLLYHRVVLPSNPIGKHKIWVTKKNMEKQLSYLFNRGFKTITFQDLADPIFVPGPKHIILTFDDGYADNYTNLFPLLRQFGFKAVIYLVTGTDHNAWGYKEGEPKIQLMSHAMIKEMAEYGVEFGGHTHTHIDMSRADKPTMMQELTQNFNALTNILGHPPVSFAYPFGGINDLAIECVKEIGYTFAVATNTGAIHYNDDLFRIRRIEIRPQNSLLRFKYKVSGLYFRRGFLSFLWKSITAGK